MKNLTANARICQILEMSCGINAWAVAELCKLVEAEAKEAFSAGYKAGRDYEAEGTRFLEFIQEHGE